MKETYRIPSKARYSLTHASLERDKSIARMKKKFDYTLSHVRAVTETRTLPRRKATSSIWESGESFQIPDANREFSN